MGNSVQDFPRLQLADFLLMKRIEQVCGLKVYENAKKEYWAGAWRLKNPVQEVEFRLT